MDEQLLKIITAFHNHKYSQKQLDQAFDLVKPDSHWKDPINALIEEDQADAVSIAIIHFTGCVPTIEPEGDKLRFTSVGYWEAMGES